MSRWRCGWPEPTAADPSGFASQWIHEASGGTSRAGGGVNADKLTFDEAATAALFASGNADYA